jgi:hypothetical protein
MMGFAIALPILYVYDFKSEVLCRVLAGFLVVGRVGIAFCAHADCCGK